MRFLRVYQVINFNEREKKNVFFCNEIPFCAKMLSLDAWRCTLCLVSFGLVSCHSCLFVIRFVGFTEDWSVTVRCNHTVSEMVFVCIHLYFSPRHVDVWSFISGILGDEKQIHTLLQFRLGFFLLLSFGAAAYLIARTFVVVFFLTFVWAAAAINKVDAVKKMKRTRICMKQTKLKTKLILCPNFTKKFILESNQSAQCIKSIHTLAGWLAGRQTGRHIGTH